MTLASRMEVLQRVDKCESDETAAIRAPDSVADCLDISILDWKVKPRKLLLLN